MSAISWKTGVGVNHVGAYQVSGAPFATGSIDTTGSATATRVAFPKVTRWFQVINRDHANAAKVGFSLGSTESPLYELKVSEIWLTGSGKIDVVAGLTNIDDIRVSASAGNSWSGSVGVG
jgi:hypothetical protein